MKRYEIAILGNGPAGLEAAITAKLRNKDILLLGGRTAGTKVEKAHRIQNYLGLPDITGEQLQSAFDQHLQNMEIAVTEDRIGMVYAMGNYFALQGQKEMYEADSVILACGMTADKTLPGEEAYLGRGVSYCATCDGALCKNRHVTVIGYTPEAEKEAEFLAELAAEVLYLPMYPEEIKAMPGVRIRKDAIPVGIGKTENRMLLKLQDDAVETDGIFLLRSSVAPAQLVPGLKMEQNHVAVNRSMETNLPGLFACGDITGMPYQYSKAAGEGNVAALSAVRYLAQGK